MVINMKKYYIIKYGDRYIFSGHYSVGNIVYAHKFNSFYNAFNFAKKYISDGKFEIIEKYRDKPVRKQ